MNQIFSEITQHILKGENAALAIIVKAHGSAPRGAGAVMALFEDGTFAGTIGGGAVEFESQKLCQQVLKNHASFSKDFDLGPGQAASLGMICGGNVSVFFQYLNGKDPSVQSLYSSLIPLDKTASSLWLIYKITPSGWACGVTNQDHKILHPVGSVGHAEKHIPALLQKKAASVEEQDILWYSQPLSADGQVFLFGGGHVARQLVPTLHRVFFETTVIDDREEFANPQAFPEASQTIVSNYDDVFNQLTITANDYIIIMTRGHLADYSSLKNALHTPAKYIGMIGSQSKIGTTFTKLITQDSFTYTDIKRVHAPIGLPIGGETPEEIALGVAAQLVGVRNGLLK